MSNTAERTLYITNLEDRVDKEILEELFTQMGPVESVSIIPGGPARYAFVQFVDEESVLFSIKMMDGLFIFGTAITVRPRAGTKQDMLYKQMKNDNQRRPVIASNRNNNNDYVHVQQPNQRRTGYASNRNNNNNDCVQQPNQRRSGYASNRNNDYVQQPNHRDSWLFSGTYF